MIRRRGLGKGERLTSTGFMLREASTMPHGQKPLELDWPYRGPADALRYIAQLYVSDEPSEDEIRKLLEDIELTARQALVK